jgi:endonuclease YncB( thermonuclease family)
MVIPKNVSLEMVQAGYAILYEQANAEYHGLFEKLQVAEQTAR